MIKNAKDATLFVKVVVIKRVGSDVAHLSTLFGPIFEFGRVIFPSRPALFYHILNGLERLNF